jgi:hypothetical protein
MANEKDGAAGERDPIVVWLEEIRDFAGANTRSRELAQQAIDRLEAGDRAALVDAGRRGAPDQESPANVGGKIERIVEAAREETERGRRERRQ